MITCRYCKIDKEDDQFYASSVPEDITYHFCKFCVKVKGAENYALAKKLIADNSKQTAACFDCLEEKTAISFSPCQLSSHLTGFWAFCRECANARSRDQWQKKKDARRMEAELLGEEVKPVKKRKESAYRKKKRIAREKLEAEMALTKAKNVSDAVVKMRKLRYEFAKDLLGD